MPSDTRYVKVLLPTNEPPDLYVNPPPADRDNDPFEPPSTRDAVNVSPSASVSFARTPGSRTVSSTAVVAAYESFLATGAALVTSIVTMAAVASSPLGL
ncbi:MAG TPA: hypothetical protein VKA85_07420 [Candidatus Limnocylindrales bacterium]|nr:hypothetical protein [Candidatus Limnocylindrales bacterium]